MVPVSNGAELCISIDRADSRFTTDFLNDYVSSERLLLGN